MRGTVVLACLLLGGAALAGGFGGPSVGLLFWDISSLNGALAAAGYSLPQGPLLLYGGIGAGGEGVRFGGGGFGGSAVAREEGRYAEISLGFGAALVEVEALKDESFVASVGAFLGGGGASLILRSRSYSDFSDALSGPGDLYLRRGFFALLPYVSADFWPAKWLGVKAVLGYLLSFPGPWEAGGTELQGPPEDFGGPFLSVQLAFGGRGNPPKSQD